MKAAEFHEQLTNLVNRALQGGCPLGNMIFTTHVTNVELVNLHLMQQRQLAMQQTASKIVSPN